MSVKTETKKEEIVKSASTTILERLAQNSARRLQVLVLAIHVMDQETKSVKSITSLHRYVTHTVYRLQETIRVTRILERGSVWRARREKTVMSARISTKKEEIVKIASKTILEMTALCTVMKYKETTLVTRILDRRNANQGRMEEIVMSVKTVKWDRIATNAEGTVISEIIVECIANQIMSITSV